MAHDLATRPASERISIAAPLSYTGSAQRIRRLASPHPSAPVQLVLIATTLTAWVFVTVWYIVFSVLLVPYRIVRRGSRKRKLEAARHRELLAANQGRERRSR